MLKRKKNSLMDSAVETAEGVKPTLESAVETARDKAGPLLEEAREKATPILQEGKDYATEVASQGREYAAEKAPVVKAAAAEKAAQGREYAAQGREYAAEKAPVVKAALEDKVNEMRGIEPEPEPKKGSKLKKLFFVGVLVGVGAYVYKLVRGEDAGQANWQSSYVPAPAPSTASGAGAAASGSTEKQDDQGAAAPGEAISDATDEPKKDTDPEDPAEVIDLDSRQN